MKTKEYIDNIMKSTTVNVECSYGTEIVLSELYNNIYQQGIDDFVYVLCCQACFTNAQKDAIRRFSESIKEDEAI